MDYGFAIFIWLMGFLTALIVSGCAVSIVLLLELLNRAP